MPSFPRVLFTAFLAPTLLGAQSAPALKPAPKPAPTRMVSFLWATGLGSWSGPFVSGGKTAGLVGLAYTQRVRPQWGVRAEVSNSLIEANLSVHSADTERAYLSANRGTVTLVGRRYFAADTARNQWYVDAGLAVRSQGCDINESGGLADVGFFAGDMTQACADFRDTAGRRLFSKVGHGAAAVVAAGVDGRRFGVQVRAEPFGSAVADAVGGSLSVRTVTAALQWHMWRR